MCFYQSNLRSRPKQIRNQIERGRCRFLFYFLVRCCFKFFPRALTAICGFADLRHLFHRFPLHQPADQCGSYHVVTSLLDVFTLMPLMCVMVASLYSYHACISTSACSLCAVPVHPLIIYMRTAYTSTRRRGRFILSLKSCALLIISPVSITAYRVLTPQSPPSNFVCMCCPHPPLHLLCVVTTVSHHHHHPCAFPQKSNHSNLRTNP